MYNYSQLKTKSCAIAKTTAQCTPHGCPENFRDSLTTFTATFSKNVSWAFVLIDPMNVRTKFKVCSFICY